MCAPERQVTLAYYVPEKISAQRKHVNMHIKKKKKILTAMVLEIQTNIIPSIDSQMTEEQYAVKA